MVGTALSPSRVIRPSWATSQKGLGDHSPWIGPFSESRVIRPGHWERAQISEMGIIGS